MRFFTGRSPHGFAVGKDCHGDFPEKWFFALSCRREKTDGKPFPEKRGKVRLTKSRPRDYPVDVDKEVFIHR
ncbi:MAG: hypothetical protein IJP37_00545 [Clostridia bacterium]|nr:hypothetical protein [Clostridia bacterium]